MSPNRWHGNYTEGWAKAQPNFVPFLETTYPEDPAGPDEVQSDEDKFLWRKFSEINQLHGLF